MEIVDLSSQRRFRPEKMQKVPVFESGKFFFDQYCLMPGQFQKVHRHALEDKVYLVLEGLATITIGEEQASLSTGQAIIARAGIDHGVQNDSDERVVLLVCMAPRPDVP